MSEKLGEAMFTTVWHPLFFWHRSVNICKLRWPVSIVLGEKYFVPFLPDIELQLNSPWSLLLFAFENALNLYTLIIWSAGRPMQDPDWDSLCLPLRRQQSGVLSRDTSTLSRAVVVDAICGFALSCWNIQGLSWKSLQMAAYDFPKLIFHSVPRFW